MLMGDRNDNPHELSEHIVGQFYDMVVEVCGYNDEQVRKETLAYLRQNPTDYTLSLEGAWETAMEDLAENESD